MRTVLITGSAGLIGSEAVRFFCERGHTVVGLDNDMRRHFFGPDASTEWNRRRLSDAFGDRYLHHPIDIRNAEAVGQVFRTYGDDIGLVIHSAAQPSHDWAARAPRTDFTVNANGTLVLLEHARRTCPEAAFIFCSTNKVYGDTPNRLPFVEQALRWEIEESHPYWRGIDESMSIDQTRHSLFGSSKLAADILVQEYGRYFGMRTVVFRAGCVTGPSHSGAEQHGFLSYLMRCTVTGAPYTVFGYEGKQVRDNVHSADLIDAFHRYSRAPRVGEVYNIGGGRSSHCSMLEAIRMCEEISGRTLEWTYSEEHRLGDHIWWISDTSKFRNHYPDWRLSYDSRGILEEIHAQNHRRWTT